MLNYALTGDDKEKVTKLGIGHYGSEAGTGETQDDKILNIFDLGGNHAEWTLESYKDSGRVHRGGYYDNGKNFSPSSRIVHSSDGTNTYLATRLTLYINPTEN